MLTCTKCSAYLRERIFNIDLWDIITRLIESPSRAFTRIIQAEHKNFIFFIIIFAAIKLSITSIYLSLGFMGKNHYVGNIFYVFLITLGIIFIVLIVSSLLLKYIMSAKQIKIRFKDNFAVSVYSLMPYIFGLAILFPIELILFGYTVFSVNPSPFIVKETLAYVMSSFEILCILWSILLSFFAFRKQTSDYLWSSVFTLFFNALLYGAFMFSAIKIYSI